MNITEYCDAINVELRVTYYPNQNERWCASIDRCETSDGHMLISEHGNGCTPMAAVSAYVSKIRGKTIVIGAMTENRREFVVPKNITVTP